ncbi:MAG: hypothetical protein JO216_04485 [Hyphomicrobiales bacterium]|nr:hypothetical protein [Hyphomicrobiales bacterium]
MATDESGAGGKMKEWLRRFRYYREPPDEDKIRRWLAAFDRHHQQVAFKILDEVVVVGETDIQSGYRKALRGLKGWHADLMRRNGRWFFVGFGRPGESGPAMLRSFREANKLASSSHDELFKALPDLPGLKLTARDHVVFVDDFAGTGKQVIDLWPRIAELVASEARCYLILTALTTNAEQVIKDNTDLNVISHYVIKPDKAVFHAENRTFSVDEKIIIEKYCRIADSKRAKGFGELGVLFILHHKTPNNALPILYASHRKWQGLFPRYLQTA